MSTRRETRELPLLELRAAVEPASLDEDSRTVDLVWTTGARVLRGFWDRYWEELSLDPGHVRMGRLEAGAPLLDSHRGGDTAGVIGVVEDARIEKGRGVARVRFASELASPAAERIWQKVREGVLRNVSVGYAVHRLELVEESEGEAPVYRATDWEPMELSIVPIGADPGASVRAGGAVFPCEIIRGGAEDMKPKGSGPAQDPANTAPAPAPEPAAPAVSDAERESIAATERGRVQSIRRTAKALGLDDAAVDVAVEDGTGADEFRERAIELFERAMPPVAKPGGDIVAGEDARDKWRAGASAWLLQRSGAAATVEEYARKRGERADLDPGEFRGMSLIDLARESLERSGVRTRGMSRLELAGQALVRAGLAGAAATGDFPVLLENTLHKVLLAAYGVTPDTWSAFCAVGSASDFRPNPRYRMGTFGALDAVAEGGEFTNKSIPDGRKESITLATKGNIIGLTRQAIVNDDMSAFSRLAGQLGRAARLSIEVDTYALLALNSGLGPAMTDGDTLFHANHGNVGAGAALSAAAVDADRVILASQTDESGNEILALLPSVLVLPIGLGSTARQINDAQYDPDTAGALKPNTSRGLFTSIVDTPRLSGTRRYMFADPAIAPVLEVIFLDGQQAPYLEMRDGWRVDGVEWKVRLDYAVGAIDYRGAVTDAGA